MKGSWAGAMGQTQFMPSSYLAHAQDYDGDGRRDIWTTLPDVFASIANYMKAYGWVDGQAWGREVKLPRGGLRRSSRAVGPAPERLPRLARDDGAAAAGEVAVARRARRPRARRCRRSIATASLLRAGSKTYLVYGNYDALLGYNCAHAYALAVGLLSDRIPTKMSNWGQTPISNMRHKLDCVENRGLSPVQH